MAEQRTAEVLRLGFAAEVLRSGCCGRVLRLRCFGRGAVARVLRLGGFGRGAVAGVLWLAANCQRKTQPQEGQTLSKANFKEKSNITESQIGENRKKYRFSPIFAVKPAVMSSVLRGMNGTPCQGQYQFLISLFFGIKVWINLHVRQLLFVCPESWTACSGALSLIVILGIVLRREAGTDACSFSARLFDCTARPAVSWLRFRSQFANRFVRSWHSRFVGNV